MTTRAPTLTLPTVERILSVLRYDAETGHFFWRDRSDIRDVLARRLIGKEAGTPGRGGYTVIKIDGRGYMAHRLAWKIVTGEDPADQIDHINGCASDNRFANLREANTSQNQCNTRWQRRSLSGYRGVRRRKNRWNAEIKMNGRYVFLGSFTTAEAASEAYETAARKGRGEFYRSAE